MLPALQNRLGDEPPAAALRFSGATPGNVDSPGVVSVPGSRVSGNVLKPVAGNVGVVVADEGGGLPSALEGGKAIPGEPSEGLVAMPLGVAIGGVPMDELPSDPGVVAAEPRPDPPVFGAGVTERVCAWASDAAAKAAIKRGNNRCLRMSGALQAPCRRGFTSSLQ